MAKFWKYLCCLLLLLSVVVIFVCFTFPDQKLHLIACDVGQGDAILAIHGETQVLIDGGPDRKVVDCLSKYVPFWDRNIEVVLLTHPEKDHFGGLIDVFKRYKVEKFVVSSLNSSAYEYRVLKELVGGGNTDIVNPIPGMVIGNSMIRLDIVYPSEAFINNGNDGMADNVLGSFTSDKSANIYSLVAILSMGEFDAVFLGDVPAEVSGDVIAELKNHMEKRYEYIKVPHHGSKNGLTQDLLELIKPVVAVISVGKNQWGHPHQEILDMLDRYYVKTFRTDTYGDIHLISNGMTWYIKK